MKKYSLLFLALFSIDALAVIKIFLPQESVKSSDINNNFNEVQQVLQNKNTPVVFNQFQSGSVISRQNFEIEFDKVRNLGVIVDSLVSDHILSAELNNIFLQILTGVTHYDDIPSSSNVSFSTNEDQAHSVIFSYLNNVDLSVVQIVTNPVNGSLIPSGNTFIYTPNLNYNGTDSFSYNVSDGNFTSNTSNALVVVNPINDAPISNSQSLSLNEDGSIAITLSASDVDNNPLAYSVVTLPNSGTLIGSGTNYTFTPALDFNGSLSFTFKANDGTVDSNFATVSIQVNSVNDVPVAIAQSLAMNEDGVLAITLTATDADNNPLTYSVVSPPASGIITGSGPNLTYTPDLNFNGNVNFTFKVNDGTVDSNIATISLTINPVNDAPIANSQTLFFNEDESLSITLTASDVENNPLNYAVVNQPASGTLVGSGISYTYTPVLNFNGNVNFTFKVNDGTVDSNIATISLTINPVNDLPVMSGNQSLTIPATAISVASTVSATDVEGSSITYSIGSTNPAKGVVTFGANGAYTYVANLNAFGLDSFTVKANDGAGNSSDYSISVVINLQNSCKSLLALRPSLLNQNNIYHIDIDGLGSLQPAQVGCDMTTNGGGWTNLAANIGAFSNVFVGSNYHNGTPISDTATPISNLGISSSTQSTSAVGGSLVSTTGNGTCVGTLRKLKLSSQVLGYLQPTQSLMTVKSYGTGTYDCGGILRHSDLTPNTPPLVKINPSNFNSFTLGKCDGFGNYPSAANSSDLTFYTTFRTIDYSFNNTIMAIETICGSGTGYGQMKQILVR